MTEPCTAVFECIQYNKIKILLREFITGMFFRMIRFQGKSDNDLPVFLLFTKLKSDVLCSLQFKLCRSFFLFDFQ